ncbi:hypothetical protein [Neobacillus bataviensis]|uniref:hypothetical protein n=1 Tax=Neobacillus bataviensis TaxID=220685 RepID=UPI001CBA9073|nr:hypothetical protein [Neobacillus bataviensis]
MENKLDRVSIKLIEELVEISVNYYRTILIENKENKEELLKIFKINPLFSLMHALKLNYSKSEDFVKSRIFAAIRGEISVEKCTEEIISEYEEYYFDRLEEEYKRHDAFYADNQADIEYEQRREKYRSTPIDRNKKMTAMILHLDMSKHNTSTYKQFKNTWVFKLYYHDDLMTEIGDFDNLEFESEKDVLNFINDLVNSNYNITEVINFNGED